MKHIFLMLGVVTFSLLTSCGDSSTSSTSTNQSTEDTGVSASENTSNGPAQTMTNDLRYVDLNTGQNFQMQYDTINQVTMDQGSGKPVQIYVNTETMDTFDTRGINVNNAIERSDAGWKVNGDKLKMKSGDVKIKMDGDKIKIKDGDTKTKMEGDETKTKTDDIKVKEENGEVKIKDK